jgi:hypothetical protein
MGLEMQKRVNLEDQNQTIKTCGVKFSNCKILGVKLNNCNFGGQNRTIVKFGRSKLHLNFFNIIKLSL